MWKTNKKEIPFMGRSTQSDLTGLRAAKNASFFFIVSKHFPLPDESRDAAAHLCFRRWHASSLFLGQLAAQSPNVRWVPTCFLNCCTQSRWALAFWVIHGKGFSSVRIPLHLVQFKMTKATHTTHIPCFFAIGWVSSSAIRFLISLPPHLRCAILSSSHLGIRLT